VTCEYATLDGAYVLGALSPTERAEFERHLGTCAECSRSVGELAGLPGLLAKAPADVLDQPAEREPVPPTLLSGLIAEARKQDRRRSIRTAVLAAAAVAVIAGGSAALAGGLRGGETPEPDAAPTATVTITPPTVTPPTVTTSPETAPRERMDAVQGSGSQGWISLVAVAGGTRLELDCRYEGRHAYTYEILVRTADGREETAGTVRAVPGKTQHFVGQASVPPRDIVEVLVGNEYGAILRLTR